MNTLLVLLGPTGVGKTEWGIRIAELLNTEIISADSRQIYIGMEIGTAAPSKDQLKRVHHHFIGVLPPDAYYSASEYESDALKVIHNLHKQHPTLVMVGGSMMYINAICEGIDEIPTIDDKLREDLYLLYKNEGLDPIRKQLKILDPVFYDQVDLKNPKRVIHALEVCIMAGKPYSELRTNQKKERPFRIKKIGFNRNRDELYSRINLRVDEMINDGLVEEALNFYPYRHYNSLNTVGYKELFNYFDGNGSLEFAIEKIKQHSRNYARKQMTWFGRDKDINWINLSDNNINVEEEVFKILN